MSEPAGAPAPPRPDCISSETNGRIAMASAPLTLPIRGQEAANFITLIASLLVTAPPTRLVA